MRMRTMLGHATLPALLGLALGGATCAVASAGDTSGSMRVGDLQYGNAFDPTGWAPLIWPKDPDGMSWLHAGMLRTPTGLLYPYPGRADTPNPLGPTTDWTFAGALDVGYLHVGGDRNAEFFRQYAGWKNGPVLGLLYLGFNNPKTGSYVEFRGSRLSGDDQYYRLRGGRYGHYRVEAFYRDMPHTVSTTSYPLWNGVGGTDLTLPSPLVAGQSTPAEVAAVESTRPRRTIGLTRTRSGISYEGTLYRGWIGYAGISNEKRNGTRLWGGPMFFSFPGSGLAGAALETVRPIDFTTTDVNLGLRNVGRLWRFNAVYTGSFFRDHKDHLYYQSPYHPSPVVPGVPLAGIIDTGQFALEPDNDYHNLRLELARPLKHDGELSMAAAWGTMRQNDTLMPPTACTGSGGFVLGPADYSFDCADWNTPAALSQTRANARIDTGLLDLKLSFHPNRAFGWHAGLRYYKEDNKTRYLSYNPLTGQYGYISENGTQGTVVPGELGIFDPKNPLYWSALTQIANMPFSYQDTVFTLAGDWYASLRDTLTAEYTFDHDQPKYRERKRVDEQRIKLSWVHRASDGPTIRLSWEYADRTGDHYNYDPYEQFFSDTLPGYVWDANGIYAYTTDAMRKYDLGDRKESKARLILTWPVGDSATVSTTFHGTRDQYGPDVGRQSNTSTGFTASWDWQPSPATSFNANLGVESTRLKFANVADDEALIDASPTQDDPTLGGALYPWANYWWDIDRERDYNAGISFAHDFGRVRLDASYNWLWSVSKLDYERNSDGSLTYPQDAALLAPPGSVGVFPDNHYRTGTLDLGLNFAVTRMVGVRLFGRYQRGSFQDWHYAGFEQSLVIGNKVYTDMGPQRHYSASLVGVMLNMKL